MGHRLHAGSQLFLLCGLVSLCVFDIRATPLPKRNRLRRERLLRPEFGNSLSLLRSTFLPQGEVANRISGNEWKRAFGGLTGRPVNPFLPDRRDTILTSKTVAALGAGLAAVAGYTIDNNRTSKANQHPNSKQATSPQSQCSKAAEQLFKTLDHALNTSSSPSQQGKRDNRSWNASRNSRSNGSSNASSGSSFLAQSGYIDFGMTDSQDSQAACHPNCAFSNPSVAYGLTVLPLNPSENVTAKVTNDKTPGYVKDNLDGHYGDRMSPVWQLQQDEVVVLAGCTPPGEASRYFGVTGYIYSTYIADNDQWINVFASLGDSASITTISDAAAAAAGSAHNEQQQQQHTLSDNGSAAPGFRISSGRLKTSTSVSESSSSDSSSSECSSRSSSFGALTVVLMGANPTTVDAAAATIRSSIAAAAANTRTSNSKVAGLHPLCPDYVNIIPIPGPGFSDAIGLNPTSSYYTLVARNMAPSGDEGAAAFQAYVEHPYLKAWRLTPGAGSSSSSSSNSSGGSRGDTADRDVITAFTSNRSSSNSSSGYHATASSNTGQQHSALPNVTAAAGAAAADADDEDDYEADSDAAPAAAVQSKTESHHDLRSNSSSSSRTTTRSSNTSSTSSSSTGSNSFGLPYVIPRHSYDSAGVSFIMNSSSGSSSGSNNAATEGTAGSAAASADSKWRGTISDRDTAALPGSSSSNIKIKINITSHNSSSVNGSHTGLTACTSAQPSSMSRGPPCSIHQKLAAAVAVGVSRAINQLLVAQPAVAESLRNDIIMASQTESGTYTENASGDENSGEQSAISSSTSQGSRQQINISSIASDLVKLTSNSSSSNTSHNHSRNATSGSLSGVSAAAKSSDQRSAAAALSDHQNNATARWRQQQQQQQRMGPTLLQQQQMLDQLLTAVDIRYNSSYAIAFGMGSAGSLALLGVDWGLDCVEQTLDWCNGDNRDATYLSSLPLFTLNRPGQLLVVVGVNYVTAGVGSYMNIAVTDPIQQLGLEAFDDVELAAAAVPWPAPAPAAASGANISSDPGVQTQNVAARLSQRVLQKLMYVVAFSRNCTGVDLPCKELTPANHPRNIPISRPLMTISRVYVNPATGVGPDPRDLIPFVTLLLTPKDVAVPGDYVARTNMSVWQTFGGREVHDQERSSMPAVAALQQRNSSRHSNHSSSSNSTTSGSSSASASSINSGGWLQRRPRLARWLEPNVLMTNDRLRQQRSGLSPPRATRRWTNSSGDFDPLAAAEATRCPNLGLEISDKQVSAISPTEDTDHSNSGWSGAVLAFDQMMALNRTALRLIAESAHSVDSNTTEVVTAAQAAIDPCVRSLVGLSQCGGRGSPDVCCRLVQAWNDQDCWCEASGQVLLSTMPAVLTPTLLQLLSWVCEAQ